jgi:hypothetical protein
MSFVYRHNILSDFYGNLSVIIHLFILIILPAIVLLVITITKSSFLIQPNRLYKLLYTLLRRFSYFTIVSSILLFALTTVFSRS